MRYKIVKEKIRNNSKVFEYYYVMKEVKKWYHRKPVWKNCREFTYDRENQEDGFVRRSTLKEAEDYIKDMIKADNESLQPEDIKIYECRDTKLDKILN